MRVIVSYPPKAYSNRGAHLKEPYSDSERTMGISNWGYKSGNYSYNY